MRSRMLLVALLAATWMVAAASRLVYLQVVRHDYYRQRAAQQQQRVVEIDAPRGTIYDAQGRELAVSVEVDSAYAVPREIEDPRKVARDLAKVLHLDAGKLAAQLSNNQDGEFVWVGRKLDPPVAEQVRALDLPGVHFIPESKRYYPMGELAAAVLGIVGTDDQGLEGLELAYNDKVAGKSGRRTVLRDARRDTVITPELPAADAEPGRDLYLTLDASIQYLAESELRRAAEETNARSASVVLLEPNTGAVLAMASYPSFDPNHFRGTPKERRRNLPVMDAYEPGSTFKMVTTAAAIEAHKVDFDEVIDCQMGSITLYNQVIHDHRPFAKLTFRQVIAHSSNIGTLKVGLRVPKQDFYQVIRRFGFGQPTGIDLPGESSGILRSAERWQGLTQAYISFGQGVAVTPVQLVRAFAVVANGGTLLRPYVVRAIGDGDRITWHHAERVADGYPVAPSTTGELRELLEGVVSGGGGEKAAIEGYLVAGKTGTAEVAVPGHGYSRERYIASFAGFVPARHPALVGLVVIDGPRRGSIFGGQIAAPVFARIARRVLLYLGIPPDEKPPDQWPAQQQAVAELAPATPTALAAEASAARVSPAAKTNGER